MLWQQYVLRRGSHVHDMWDSLFEGRPIRLLYIAGRGFDVRAESVMRSFVEAMTTSKRTVSSAVLLLISFSHYRLSDELKEQTELNATSFQQLFQSLGSITTVSIGSSTDSEEDVSASNALRTGTEQVLNQVTDQTDIVLDASSLPRVVYLALLTGLLQKLIPDKGAPNALWANGVNLQVLVAEDAALDGHIQSEDPSNDLVLIPGFSSVLHAESVQDWPLVWFPILGANRVSQLQKVMDAAIPSFAEICPILPHPSRDLRLADRLLVDYKKPLFDARQTPTGNILYVHEAHPFEAYRQILGAMHRYRQSMQILGGCRLVVTPLASKLITVGAGLACFEMRPGSMNENYGVAIPYAEPTRYVASPAVLRASRPEMCSLLLTGNAYDLREPETEIM